MIKEKGFVEKDLEENIKIPKFNSSDETGRFFLGVIEDIGQGIEDKVLDAVVLQAWNVDWMELIQSWPCKKKEDNIGVLSRGAVRER
nr:hypothetical protein CFP56_05177 [Quercus suber]